jgi:drug/metabolite transporter (DMT)-like permease
VLKDDDPSHRPALGVTFKLVSIVLLASMSACIKYLGGDVPAGQIIFIRGVMSLPLLSVVAWRASGLRLLATRNWRAHAARSIMGTGAMFCWFTGVTLIPLAEFTTLTFTVPIFVTILAMILLGERIHVYRWTALVVGLSGVTIMIGPYLSFGSDSTAGVAVSLGAAVFSAFAMIFLRSMSGAGGEHPITITFYFALTTMVCSALTAPFGWTSLTYEQWIVVIGAGLLGVCGQLLMSYAYRFAEASTIAPLDYSTLLLAVGYGYVLFAETPGPSIWIGAPLVIASGLVIILREYRSSTPVATEIARPG